MILLVHIHQVNKTKYKKYMYKNPKPNIHLTYVCVYNW